IDLVYFVYFISRIIPAVLIDHILFISRSHLAFNLLKSMVQYIENFNDPFFIKSPTWFISCLYMETCVRLPMLIYSVHVSTTTFECLSELFFGDHEGLLKSQRNLLLSFYFPYFMIPFICLIDSFFRINN
ncbi:hypothetical protein C2G38_1950290, partial [Gigaspora rosea]